MKVLVRSIAGVGRIPHHRTSAADWLARHGVKIARSRTGVTAAEFVSLSDLPAPERRAVIEAQLAEAGLDPGTYDDDAHAAFLTAPPSMRDEAERKAAIARYLIVARGCAKGAELHRLVRAKFGAKGTSEAALKRLLKAVQGVDPINFAPALLAGHKGRTVTAPMSDAAWQVFLSLIERASPDWPLKRAYVDVRDLAPGEGWAWSSYPTVFRRWQALPESNRQLLRYGRAATLKAMTQPARRDKTTVRPMEVVSLDGRTQDYWVDYGDGRAVRPVMIALVDVASNLILGYRLARSENATDTVGLIVETCERHGIFDRLYTDNGSAFAGHLVAGGARHRFRTHGRAVDAPTPPGVCEHLGIATTFATPGNARAKIAERVFATLSRQIDDRPEFDGAHAGHNPGAAPTAAVTPVPIAVAEAVTRREVHRHNTEAGRRGQGANGRSYQAAFDAGMADRIPRFPTARQLYLAGLIYKWVAVDRFGQVHVNGWTYGGPDTQDTLLRYRGHGRCILLGRNPDDFEQPAIAFDADRRLICESIAPVHKGVYMSADGIRQEARNRKAARRTAAANEAANRTRDDHEMDALLARLPGPAEAPEPVAPARRVVAGRFGGPVALRAAPDAPPAKAATTAVDPDFMASCLANLDASLGLKRSGGEGA